MRYVFWFDNQNHTHDRTSACLRLLRSDSLHRPIAVCNSCLKIGFRLLPRVSARVLQFQQLPLNHQPLGPQFCDRFDLEVRFCCLSLCFQRVKRRLSSLNLRFKQLSSPHLSSSSPPRLCIRLGCEFCNHKSYGNTQTTPKPLKVLEGTDYTVMILSRIRELRETRMAIHLRLKERNL